MKKIFLCLMVITLFAIYSFSIDAPKQDSSSNLNLKENMNMPEFVEGVILRHDSMGVIFYDTIPESLTVYIQTLLKK
jgi:hypothetical protein